MSRDYRLYLDDMREACEKVLRYTEDISLDQFVQPVMYCMVQGRTDGDTGESLRCRQSRRR